MTWSGVITSRQSGREKLYKLTSEFMSALGPTAEVFFPQWIEKLPLCEKIPSCFAILIVQIASEHLASNLVLQEH